MKLVWLTGLAALALLLGLAGYLWALKPGIVQLQLAFTPRAFGEIVHAWSPQQLARYRIHLFVDGLLLLSYGAFGYLLVVRTRLFAGAAPWVARLARWVLPLAAVFDATENVLHLWLTQAPRFGVPVVYAVSAGASSIKWLLLFSFGGLVVYALARAED